MSKRFYFASVCGDDGVYDREGSCVVVNIRSNNDLQRNWEDILDLLNSLNDEKEELYDLVKENSKLVKKIMLIREIVKEVDYFSDDATKHDIIAYREMQNFDNKDAYAIASAFEKIIKLTGELEE